MPYNACIYIDFFLFILQAPDDFEESYLEDSFCVGSQVGLFSKLWGRVIEKLHFHCIIFAAMTTALKPEIKKKIFSHRRFMGSTCSKFR